MEDVREFEECSVAQAELKSEAAGHPFSTFILDASVFSTLTLESTAGC